MRKKRRLLIAKTLGVTPGVQHQDRTINRTIMVERNRQLMLKSLSGFVKSDQTSASSTATKPEAASSSGTSGCKRENHDKHKSKISENPKSDKRKHKSRSRGPQDRIRDGSKRNSKSKDSQDQHRHDKKRKSESSSRTRSKKNKKQILQDIKNRTVLDLTPFKALNPTKSLAFLDEMSPMSFGTPANKRKKRVDKNGKLKKTNRNRKVKEKLLSDQDHTTTQHPNQSKISSDKIDPPNINVENILENKNEVESDDEEELDEYFED